jgi:iron complex transport system ATP-binding protein
MTGNTESVSESRTETATGEASQPPDDADAPTFRGEDLVVGYPGTDQPVIDGESVVAAPGEVTALVGPNGSGKSTLLKGLADQVDRDAGTVLLDGQDVDDINSKALARGVGLLSQENVAPDSLTVRELVEHGRYPHRGFFDGLTGADVAAIDRATDLAGVDHLRDREVGQLSGGQKQLVWIAMVLAQETGVLLLDEPTTFLDLHHQLQVLDVLETLRVEGETTIVVVLHDIQQAARFADYIVALEDGAVYDWGPPGEVLTEQLLADVFRVDAVVEHDPLRVSPRRALDDESD